MSRILIAEDDPGIVSFVQKGLRAAGYTTVVAEDGQSALMMARMGEFDLVLLDVGLPQLDGFTVLERLRDEGVTTPVVVLTARDSVTDRVHGLEGGANDYVTKPFQFAELLARVRLRLREPAPAEARSLRAGGMSLDLRTRQVTVEDRTVDLSGREFALLEVFMRHENQILSREQLLGHVWGYDFDPASNVVDVYVRALRRKIGADRVQTLRGSGYRLPSA
ncbi:DNA-binding response regulator [Xylanimonas oleitrophica]|uniref:DNA-binding response regulator n=1 Tax=Xylanimonas oleitrophica TaxID=2607479 RepID=A0A2W5WXJ9_9MICO|nr:response regulator transcription factor [Xylanimonas oleitrophica]PZR55382.1 DNA-binding response regulator [Xylanimonas oleitrophica]